MVMISQIFDMLLLFFFVRAVAAALVGSFSVHYACLYLYLRSFTLCNFFICDMLQRME